MIAYQERQMLYPIISGHLSGDAKPGRKSMRQMFQEIAIQVEHYFVQGRIPNTVFVDAKFTLNDALDNAYEVIRQTYVSGRYQSLSEPMRKFTDQFGIIYLHMVPGLLNRSKKLNMGGEVHPYHTEMIALLEEVAPLSEKMGVLKTATIKRTPKPIEEKVVGYYPPKVSTEAEKKVVALLDGVTQASYEVFHTQLVAHFRHGLEMFLKAQKIETKLTPYEFFIKKNSIRPNYLLASVLENVRVSGARSYVAVDEVHVALTFANEATKIADEARTFFVHKNFRKIASIIDGKKMPFEGCELQSSISLTGLEGVFFFTFDDGSQFKVVNKVVYCHSRHGKPYQRFPLTFHAVLLSEATHHQKMGRPSEERMNTVFLEDGE